MQDYKFMLDAYVQADSVPEVFKDSGIAHFTVHKNKVSDQFYS